MNFTLITPSLDCITQYKAALETGWSPNVLDEARTAKVELGLIAADAAAFVASLDAPDEEGGLIILPDGSTAPKLPGFRRWMWDGEFCGSIAFRWQKGTTDLPPTCLGHIGYSVIPAKRGKGYATKALALMLEQVKPLGLEFVQLNAQPHNLPSQKVIIANGGIFTGRIRMPEAYGGKDDFQFRIYL